MIRQPFTQCHVNHSLNRELHAATASRARWFREYPHQQRVAVLFAEQYGHNLMLPSFYFFPRSPWAHLPGSGTWNIFRLPAHPFAQFWDEETKIVVDSRSRVYYGNVITRIMAVGGDSRRFCQKCGILGLPRLIVRTRENIRYSQESTPRALQNIFRIDYTPRNCGSGCVGCGRTIKTISCAVYMRFRRARVVVRWVPPLGSRGEGTCKPVTCHEWV